MLRRLAERANAIAQTAHVVLTGCLIALVLSAVVAAASYLCTVQFGPRIGDLLRFQPHGTIVAEWKIAVRRSGSDRRCVLQPHAMAAGGGSLIVERRLADGWTYRVHWAGLRTSEAANGCGRSAELDISRSELQSLMEIGGIGQGWRFVGF